MRLFLASYRFGKHRRRLVDLVGGPGRVAVVANACDAWPVRARDAAVISELEPLRASGFTPEELDLREYLERPAELTETLADCDLVWVRGGNTFVLRAQLARSGADEALRRLLSANAVAYAGYSAGACVMAPTLHGLEASDDPTEVPPSCGIQPRWDGLGLIDHRLIVHVDSPLDPDNDAAVVAARYRADDIAHWSLTDDDAVVVDGPTTELLKY